MNIAAFSENALFSPRLLAAELRTSQEEVARTLGLGRDAIARKDRLASAKTQTRLRELVEILNRIEPRFGSSLLAYAWFRSEPLAGFGGQSAMALVRDGQAGAVMDYLDAVDDGVFA
ncbi:antitoxin Xre/MbcA/ParS toxin-binding domain-containing protein [Phaeovulum sp.]|uniref:antitoxin Xre/MbcA/ParS toxin-binding domain-containing protein n=1 Tax=Phaeovulum sp. TaxID=2934796 RepID=UPI0039E6E600